MSQWVKHTLTITLPKSKKYLQERVSMIAVKSSQKRSWTRFDYIFFYSCMFQKIKKEKQKNAFVKNLEHQK